MSEKFDKIIEEVKNMSVLELSELVSALEEEFGVSAAAAQVVVGAGEAGGEAAGEKTDFEVVLLSAGDAKLKVVKVVREITGLPLKEAKAIVDGAPKTLKESAPKEEAEEIKAKVEEAGGQVDLK